MEVPDSNLNKAHRFMRCAQDFEKFGKYDQAKVYHVSAIVCLKKSLQETDNESAKRSIEQQIEHQKIVLNLIKHRKTLKNNFEIVVETKRKLSNDFVSDDLTDSIINVIDDQKKLIQHFLNNFKDALNEKLTVNENDEKIDKKKLNSDNFNEKDENLKNGSLVLQDLVSTNELIREGTNKIIQEIICLKDENIKLKPKID